MKIKPPTEHQECLLLVEYLKLKRLKFTHIPNETFTKSWSQKHKNKKEGVSKGFPDYAIIIPAQIFKPADTRINDRVIRKSVLIFIEMKRTKLSTTSPEQKEWIEALNTVENVGAFICKGFDEAKQVIDSIIN